MLKITQTCSGLSNNQNHLADTPIDKETSLCLRCLLKQREETISNLLFHLRSFEAQFDAEKILRARDKEKFKKEIERLKAGKECHIARPGEGTYECKIHDGNSGCLACYTRSLTDKNWKLIKLLKEAIRHIKHLETDESPLSLESFLKEASSEIIPHKKKLVFRAAKSIKAYKKEEL